MISKFIVTIEHPKETTPDQIKELLEQATSLHSELWLEWKDSQLIDKITVEPQ